MKKSEYDQEIPQSQTADNPVAPRGRAKQQSRDTRQTKKSKATSELAFQRFSLIVLSFLWQKTLVKMLAAKNVHNYSVLTKRQLHKMVTLHCLHSEDRPCTVNLEIFARVLFSRNGEICEVS